MEQYFALCELACDLYDDGLRAADIKMIEDQYELDGTDAGIILEQCAQAFPAGRDEQHPCKQELIIQSVQYTEDGIQHRVRQYTRSSWEHSEACCHVFFLLRPRLVWGVVSS